MAKLPQKVDDWKAPWDDGEIDPDKAKQFVFKALKSAEAANERAEQAESDLTTEQEAHEETKTKLTELEDKDKPQIERLQAEVERLKAAPPAATKGKTKLEIAIEVGDEYGLTTAQVRKVAGRIQGDNESALRKDAKAFIEEFDLGKSRDGTDDEDDDNEDTLGWDDDREPVSNTPRVTRTKPGSGKRRDAPDSDSDFSPEKAAKLLPERR
jgi:polyhydroxyalkanoate synthesis regulator phasin